MINIGVNDKCLMKIILYGMSNVWYSFITLS